MVKVENVDVEIEPVFKRVGFNTGGDMVEGGEAGRNYLRRIFERLIAGEEPFVHSLSLDEGVDGIAVGRDGRLDEATFLLLEEGRLQHGTRAAPHRLLKSVWDIINVEGDVLNAVAMNADMLGHGAIGRERTGENQSDVVLLQHERGAVTLACLQR